MNEKSIKILEFNKIIQLLMKQAGSEMTRKVISELEPFNEERLVREGLDETEEAETLITVKGPLPLGNFYDIGDYIKLASKGGTLTMKQLLKVLYNMKITRNTVNFLKGDLPPLPILKGMAEVLEVYRELEEEIDRCILSEEEMADDASSELKSIRRDIIRQNEAVKDKIGSIINSSENRTMLQDYIVTMRDGRYVIPVKQEYKTRFPGVVHDQSASGATLFIEPQVIVDMNNRLRQLEIEEKAEIERILTELSEEIARHFHGLMNNQDILVHMDLISAKGKLAKLQKAERPFISAEGHLALVAARHPLIEKDKVVPIDVSIGDMYNALIVTGPNTGGKTVTLKTAGLLCMMAQTGLFIPAASTSRVPVFCDIFADIGDEQSIEQSLSTFSSHMKNIVEITKKAGAGSLVLLDELGAGTDPTEGAALAIALLEYLRAKNANILATTHYTELKKYALSTEGVENASMEFDVETLSPTFKLTMGIPGKSNAFEISKKLGLIDSITEKARELLSGGDLEFEEVISAIEEDKKVAEKERDQAITLNIQMKKRKEEMDEDLRRLEERKEKIINKAKEEARDMIAEAKQISDEVREELRNISKKESLYEKEQRNENARRKIKDAAGRYRQQIIKEINDDPVRIEDVKTGDRVKVLSLGQNGEIITLPDDKGEITVQVGRLKVKAKTEDLKIINEGKKKKSTREDRHYRQLYSIKAKSVSVSINVQGQNLDEARENVDKYLDDAFMAHLNEVTIIHGKGEGVLKKGINEMLKNHRHVSEYRKGGYNEGGDGVTVVKLK